MSNPVDLGTAIASAIKEIAELIKVALVGSEVRRLKYQLESAQEYIFVDERVGKYKDINDIKAAGLKVHFKRRAFDAN